MQELKAKDVLTTGEVAKICNVAPRTVSKWFDSGSLKGYRIPGSKDRRIPLNQLVRFMKDHNIPLNGLKTGNTRVLIVDGERDVVDVLEKILEDEARYEVEIAETAFAAGMACEKTKPHVMLVDVGLQGLDAVALAKHVRKNPDLQLTKLIAMVTGEHAPTSDLADDKLKRAGFDSVLRKPFHIRSVIQAVEHATQVEY